MSTPEPGTKATTPPYTPSLVAAREPTSSIASPITPAKAKEPVGGETGHKRARSESLSPSAPERLDLARYINYSDFPPEQLALKFGYDCRVRVQTFLQKIAHLQKELNFCLLASDKACKSCVRLEIPCLVKRRWEEDEVLKCEACVKNCSFGEATGTAKTALRDLLGSQSAVTADGCVEAKEAVIKTLRFLGTEDAKKEYERVVDGAHRDSRPRKRPSPDGAISAGEPMPEAAALAPVLEAIGEGEGAGTHTVPLAEGEEACEDVDTEAGDCEVHADAEEEVKEEETKDKEHDDEDKEDGDEEDEHENDKDEDAEDGEDESKEDKGGEEGEEEKGHDDDKDEDAKDEEHKDDEEGEKEEDSDGDKDKENVEGDEEDHADTNGAEGTEVPPAVTPTKAAEQPDGVDTAHKRALSETPSPPPKEHLKKMLLNRYSEYSLSGIASLFPSNCRQRERVKVILERLLDIQNGEVDDCILPLEEGCSVCKPFRFPCVIKRTWEETEVLQCVGCVQGSCSFGRRGPSGVSTSLELRHSLPSRPLATAADCVAARAAVIEALPRRGTEDIKRQCKRDMAWHFDRDGRLCKRTSPWVVDDEETVPECEILYSTPPEDVGDGKGADRETRPLIESKELPEVDKDETPKTGEGHAEEEHKAQEDGREGGEDGAEECKAKDDAEEAKDEKDKDEIEKDEEGKGKEGKGKEDKDKEDKGEEEGEEGEKEEGDDKDKDENPDDPKVPEDAKDSEDGAEDEAEDEKGGSAPGAAVTVAPPAVEGEDDDEPVLDYDEDTRETDDDTPEDSPLSPGKARTKRVVVLGNPSDRQSAWYFIEEPCGAIVIESVPRLKATQRVLGLSRENFISQRVLGLFATTSTGEGTIVLPAYLYRAAVGCKRCQRHHHACYPNLVVAKGRVIWDHARCLECRAAPASEGMVECEWNEVVCQTEVVRKDGTVESGPLSLDPHAIVKVVARAAS